MHSATLIAFLAFLTGFLPLARAASTTGKLGDATVTTNNPEGVSYQAVLLDKNTTGVRGYVTGTSNAGGTGVAFNVNLYGFPDASIYGPFIYHIHAFPVPEDGNCSATLAHLDPFIRGESPPCDASNPQTCQVGDLSGKHGHIASSGTFQTTYLDSYTSTRAGLGSFFGNLSIVVHTQNKTRLNCGNFKLVAGSQPGPSPAPSNSSSGSGTSTIGQKPATFTGSAALKTVSFGVIVVGLAAAVML